MLEVRPIILREQRSAAPAGQGEQVESIQAVVSVDFEEESDVEDPDEMIEGFSIPPARTGGSGKLMSLEAALSRIPESLRLEMKELLRADFREVRRLEKSRRS